MLLLLLLCTPYELVSFTYQINVFFTLGLGGSGWWRGNYINYSAISSFLIRTTTQSVTIMRWSENERGEHKPQTKVASTLSTATAACIHQAKAWFTSAEHKERWIFFVCASCLLQKISDTSTFSSAGCVQSAQSVLQGTEAADEIQASAAENLYQHQLCVVAGARVKQLSLGFFLWQIALPFCSSSVSAAKKRKVTRHKLHKRVYF